MEDLINRSTVRGQNSSSSKGQASLSVLRPNEVVGRTNLQIMDGDHSAPIWINSSGHVKTREGHTAKIMLSDGWKAIGVTGASITDKAGDFVGVASLPKKDGGDGALEVLIFPSAMKGTGEGNSAWDLQPHSSMTNATVSNFVTAVDGKTVTLSYHGTEKKISIANGTPIVTFGPASQADIKPGAMVFIPSKMADDGTLSTGVVIVGTNGVAPPM